MRFNQFSYYPVTNQQALQELSELGFKLDLSASHKEQFEVFVRTCFFNYKKAYALPENQQDKFAKKKVQSSSAIETEPFSLTNIHKTIYNIRHFRFRFS